MSKLQLLIIGFSLFIGACSVQPIAQIEPKLFNINQLVSNPIDDVVIDSLLKVHKVNGVSIAYAKDKDDYWAKGYGFTDAKHKTSVNANTSFQVAEISQTLSIYALFNLIQNKKIYLDSDLRDLLSELEITNNFPDQHLGVRNLLKHRGGLNIAKFESYSFGDSLPNNEQILHGISPAKNEAVQVEYEPINTLKYSEASFQLIQAIIEKKMRESYDSYITNYVFYPLKMTNSSFTHPLNDTNASNGFYSRKKQIDGGYEIYPQAGAQGLWTSANDLIRFVNNLMWAVRSKSNYLDHDNSLDMLNNQFGVNYNESNMSFNYEGKNNGFTTHFVGSIMTGRGIVIMANSANADALINDIYRLLN